MTMRIFCFISMIVLWLGPLFRELGDTPAPGDTNLTARPAVQRSLPLSPPPQTIIISDILPWPTVEGAVPLPQLAQRIINADRVVVTNDSPGATPSGFAVEGSEVSRIIQAVAGATREGNQPRPDWVWDCVFQFYTGSNRVAAIRFARDTFLADGVCRDSTGVLERLYEDAGKREYLVRIYGDEEKEMARTTKAEAREWLKSPQRVLPGENRTKVAPYVDQFYAAGAPTVYLAGLKKPELGSSFTEGATHLLVELPQNSRARRRVFFVHLRAADEWGGDPEGDVGQKYLWYKLD